MFPQVARRLLSTKPPGKLEFYQLLAKSKSGQGKSDLQALKTQSFTFDTRAKKDLDNPDVDTIFGYSGKNKSTKSSRRDVSYRAINRRIAGVTVPKKPVEPDNCCMSGCVNCVWELFDEDLQEWKMHTKQAAEALMSQKADIKEQWPTDFDPPPSYLPEKYIPLELRETKRVDDRAVEMPLGLQVFADFEKKKKQKKKSAQPQAQAQAQAQPQPQASQQSNTLPPQHQPQDAQPNQRVYT